MKPIPLLAGVLLGLLGFAGNLTKVELFFNVDFLFGTFFVILALLRFGPEAGIVAGVIASASTYLLWNNPWAMVIFSTEILFVSLCYARSRLDMLSSMVLFWLLPGPLLGWAFYHGMRGMAAEVTSLIILKQAINAILNALLAKCAHLLFASLRPEERERPGYREFIITTMLTLTLFPALLYIVLDIRGTMATHLEDARRRSSHTARLTGKTVAAWVSDNHQIIKSLAAVIEDPQRTPQAEIQRHAEAVLANSPSFQRIGVANRNAVTVAFVPLVDELGHAMVGKDFSDRHFVPIMRETRQPYVGDVHMGRVGRPTPAVPLLAPFVLDGVFNGYIAGILALTPLNSLLTEIVGPRNLIITLLDRQGNIITSTDPKREMMTPWQRPDGEIRPISEDVFSWLPEFQAGSGNMERWRGAHYFCEIRVSEEAGWTVQVEAPLLPAILDITHKTVRDFSLMAGLIVLMSGLALFMSRWQSRPIIALQRLTARVASQPEIMVEDVWPASPIREVEALSRNFRQMARELRRRIGELDQINRNLDEMVRTRNTDLRQAVQELRESESLFRSIFEQATVGVALIDSNTGRFLRLNRRYCDITGHDEEEMLAGDFQHITHPDDLPVNIDNMDRLRRGEIPMFLMEKRYIRADGGIAWANLSVAPLWLPGEAPTVHLAMIQDITSLKKAEAALREMNRTLESRVEAETKARLGQERLLVQQSKMAAMGEMIGAIAHQWRQPLNAVAIIVQDIGDAFEAGSIDRDYLRRSVADAMNQVRFMSRTIDDFRNFFRPDKTKTIFEAKEAMAQVLTMLSDQLRANGILWSITCLVHDKTFGAGAPVERCEEMQVRGFENEYKQVILNLIDNAKDAILARRQATGKPVEGSIRVDFGRSHAITGARGTSSVRSVDREGPRRVISFRDNGGGIPDGILDRVFEPYFTTKEQGRGTGIGLYMTKMIIEKNMGGRITAGNWEEGAEFTIEI